MNSRVYDSLVKLCTDICRRNGKKKLLWLGDRNKTLNYTPKSDEMVLTVHRWFANKSCPGGWLYARLGDLAAKVTAALGSTSESKPASNKKQLYRVRKTWADSKSQKGAFSVLANAEKCADSNKGYSVFDENGKKVYPAGKIDLIITKSVSRFARNTVDSLTTIRQLKDNGVECYFEKENIWTFDSKGELLLTIMSSLAQEESRSISENVIWGHRKRFADGKVSIPYSRFLGYDKGENGALVINEEQAKTVRLIYRLFLEGYTPHSIAKELTVRKLLTPSGTTRWHPSTVKSILTNEKYKGDALLQKSYTVDFLTKKVKKNDGEVPQYYVESDHPAIIAPEVFDMVQSEMARRLTHRGRYSGVDKFSAKIKCGQCGGNYGPKVWHSTDKYRRIVYQCNHKSQNGCTTPHLEEQQITRLFISAVNELVTEKDEIISNLKLVRAALCDTSELETTARGLHEELSILAAAVESCVSENTRIAQDQSEYQKRYENLAARYEGVKLQLDTVQQNITDRKIRSGVLGQFIETLRTQPLITKFDERLWGSLLDCVVVYSKEDVRFVFKDGATK